MTIDFTKFTYSEKYKGGKILFFDFDIREETKHARNTFRSYRSLLYFLEKNINKKIYITKTQITDFLEQNDILILNLNQYQEFCLALGQSVENKAQDFFSRKLRNYSEAEKVEIIKNATEEQIIENIKSFSVKQKESFLEKLKSVIDLQLPKDDFNQITDQDFLSGLVSILQNPQKRSLLVSYYPAVQVSVLESHKDFLEKNLDKEEKFIQDWIDGKIDDDGNVMRTISQEAQEQIKKSRCLIFGLEFINHKREGAVNSKRFDILTCLSEKESEYVLIELKSPNADVFKVKSVGNKNGGHSYEYHLSEGISRAIPQILRYRDNLESKNSDDEDWLKIGLPKKEIAKCIILIGTRKNDDPLWESHFSSIRRNFSNSLEIMTYSDLITKIDTTIANLKNNL